MKQAEVRLLVRLLAAAVIFQKIFTMRELMIPKIFRNLRQELLV
jgi:hypothetical protein